MYTEICREYRVFNRGVYRNMKRVLGTLCITYVYRNMQGVWVCNRYVYKNRQGV